MPTIPQTGFLGSAEHIPHVEHNYKVNFILLRYELFTNLSIYSMQYQSKLLCSYQQTDNKVHIDSNKSKIDKGSVL